MLIVKMEESVSIMDSKDRRLLLKTRNLIEELLETMDVLNSPDEVARVREAELEMKEGKGRPLSELENELKKRKEI